MDFSQFVSWAFYGLIGFGFMRFDKIMRELKESIDQLNINLAVEIQKSTATKIVVDEIKDELKDLTARICSLELVQAANNCKKKLG